MNNKLKEILDTVQDVLNAGPMPENIKVVLLRVVKESILEYAKSIVPPKRQLLTAADGYSREEYVAYDVIDSINERIARDESTSQDY